MKALADEIDIIDHPISDDDLTLYVLNGLVPDFREIVASIRARESSLAFKELHDLLVGHDAYLRNLEAATKQLVFSAHGPLGSSLSRNFNGAQRDGCRSNNISRRPNYSNQRYQPNANSVISWATLPSPVLKSILRMFQ